MQKITIIGNLGKDAEVCTPQNEQDYIKLNVCVNYKKTNGEQMSQWYRVNTRQRNLEPYLKKGTKVMVHGNFRIDNFTDTAGNFKQFCNVNADYIQLLGTLEQQPLPAPVPVTESVAKQPPLKPASRAPTSNTKPTPSLTKFDDDEANDLPF